MTAFLILYSQSYAAHFVMQAVDVTMSVKKPNKAPVIKAPKKLVAANVIPKSITDVKIVPKSPVKRAGTDERAQPRTFELRTSTGESIRYTTAMPKSTHKNAGVTAIVAINAKAVVMTPITILATIATNGQSLNVFIFSPPISAYAKIKQNVSDFDKCIFEELQFFYVRCIINTLGHNTYRGVYNGI